MNAEVYIRDEVLHFFSFNFYQIYSSYIESLDKFNKLAEQLKKKAHGSQSNTSQKKQSKMAIDDDEQETEQEEEGEEHEEDSEDDDDEDWKEIEIATSKSKGIRTSINKDEKKLMKILPSNLKAKVLR